MSAPAARARALAVFLAMAALPAAAFDNDEPLADPVLETRALALAKELRCVVCQNQSIMESDAPLARDLRAVVRERIDGGDSDDEIKDYVVARYGDFVLLRPPFKPKTWALWLGPPLVALIGLAALARSWRRRRTAAASVAPPPLDSEERARLDSLLARDRGA